MRWTTSLITALVACIAGSLFLFGGRPIAGQAPPPVQQSLEGLTQPIDVRESSFAVLRSTLETPVTLELRAVPLQKAVDAFSAKLNVNVCLDAQGLANAKVDADALIHLQIRELRARDAFALMLNPLNLICVPRDGVLQITDKESTKKLFVVRIYPAADLVWNCEQVDEAVGRIVINYLTRSLDRDVWEVNGGDGTIHFFQPTLSFIVSCPESTHSKLEALLSSIRASRFRVAPLLKASGLPSLTEVLDRAVARASLPSTKIPEPPARVYADKVAEEAKRIAEAALRTALRVEKEVLKKQSMPATSKSK